MGAYLSTPSTKKVSSDEDGKHVAYGASSMQGWRMSQEDAHNCCIDFDDNVSLFAVYDGHGGNDVSLYCSHHLPEYIKNIESYKNGDVKQALIDAFLGFDASLKTPEVVKILKEIAKGDSNDSDNEGDNVARLRLEASMPIEQVLSKYKTEIEDCIIKRPQLRENTSSGEASSSGASSSGIAGSASSSKASSGAGPSSAAGSSFAAGSSSSAGSSSGVGSSSCTRSSRQWENNDANVSSSSQQCELASSSGSKNKASNSNEADQELDSTTSNGDAAPTSQVGSSEDSKPVKASEMPDSSEDADENVSPSKVSNSTRTPSEAEVNGEVKNVEAADSSKNVNDNECSSSSGAPVENGEAGQQEKISSSGSKNNKVSDNLQDLMNDTSDDDTDDESYEHEFSDVDTNQDDEDEDEQVGEGSEEDEDEDDDDDDGDEEDDDDDEDGYEGNDIDLADSTDEPGVDSGCTAVVAILKGDELYVANAGDSRCVLCRGGEAVELSLDHKPEDQIEMDRIVKAGGKVTGDGRVNHGLNLSRALGDHAYKKNKDIPAEEQMISALPDIQTVTIDREKDEFMVLACDGIWNSMSSQSVINFVRERMQENPDKSLSKICEELFDKCLAPDTLGDGTGCDNMTAIIVKFKSSKVGETTSTDASLDKQKKRPAEDAVDENKRMKMDAC